MANKVGDFLSSWRNLSNDDKKRSLATFTPPQVPPCAIGPTVRSVSTACPETVYSKICLSSYYSKLYYYPTIHWSLDRNPDDDSYWLGIFHVNADDDDYLAYQYLKKTAQGSYYIGGKLNKGGVYGTNRTDEFELRIFKGKQRLEAKSNRLWGAIHISPTNPFAPNASTLLTGLESGEPKQPETEVLDFIRAIDASETTSTFRGKAVPLGDLQVTWDSFSSQQQQLLLPTLEQASLPDEITNPGPQDYDWPEPNIRFADAGNSLLRAANVSDTLPKNIILTITLDKSYTYVYPLVNVEQEISESKAWLGVYRAQSDTHFHPNSYLQWKWVGYGKQGCKKLNSIKERADGIVNTLYLGVIFNDKTQLGFAATKIEAAITTTSALAPATFKPEFDATKALLYAQLSNLAYESYSDVKQKLSDYNLTAEMEISDDSWDTQGFIASNQTSVVVAFRGTYSFTDFVTDSMFFLKPIEKDGKIRAHTGFVNALDAVYAEVEKKLQGFIGKKDLYFTGHSLGGALATLASYRISQKFHSADPKQYVFGCPPVGDVNLANYFEKMDSNTITIVNDPVSSIGPWTGLYKPVDVKFLPKHAGHSILYYIEQLKDLQRK